MTISLQPADKNVICNKCKKQRHIGRACRPGQTTKDKHRQQNPSKSRSKPQRPVQNVEVDDGEYPSLPQQDDKRSEYEAGFRTSLFCVGAKSQTPIVVTVKIDDKDMQMKLDTRAAVSVISTAAYERIFSENYSTLQYYSPPTQEN